MITPLIAEQIAKETLSGKRFVHTVNVKNVAVSLAQKYGANQEKAAIAALLHDIAKELSKTELLQILHQDAIISSNCEKRPFPIWHSVAGAIIAQTKYNITDCEILDAICYHTTGRPHMTKLDKIIFMADMICEDRTYKEVDALRTLVWQNLDLGTLEGLNQTIIWLNQENKPLDELTLKAYEHLRLITEDTTFE